MPRTGSVGYYESLDFNSPMTAATADRLVAELAALEPARILDVGCGWAELLLRTLVACPDATGHGVDHDEVLIARATTNAEKRGLGGRVAFSAGLDASDRADLVVSIGAEHVFGDHRDALAALWGHASPSGHLLFGAGFWEQRPTANLLETFGELPSLAELIESAAAIGWRPLGMTIASLRDWDHFELTYLADWEQVVMTSPDADDAAAARRAADAHRAGYLERRGYLGFAYLTLGRPRDA